LQTKALMANVALDLDMIVLVLRGSISNVDTLCAELAELIVQYAFSNGIKTNGTRTRVVQATHSGVRGAAWLWPIKKT
jgi:fructokinase